MTHVAIILYKCLFRLVSVLRFLPRGLFGRSFLNATVPLPVPSWTPADRSSRPRSGARTPDTDKFFRSSCGTPRRSIIRITPGRDGQVKGTHRAGAEPQGFARNQAANQHCRKVKIVSSKMFAFMLHFFNPTRRTGQRREPTRAPRQGSKRNEGGPSGSPLFFFPSFLFELSALNPSGARGTPPKNAVFSPLPFRPADLTPLPPLPPRLQIPRIPCVS
jgi:hypothetical protein